MKIAAILWDGSKRIQGKLELTDTHLKFHFLDFSHTDLAFELTYAKIESIGMYSLFDKTEQGIKIVSKTQTVNIFILEKPRKIRKQIMKYVDAFATREL